MLKDGYIDMATDEPATAWSQYDAMYLADAAFKAGDAEAAALYWDEAAAFERRDIEDEQEGRL
jgi:hypothetical protein